LTVASLICDDNIAGLPLRRRFSSAIDVKRVCSVLKKEMDFRCRDLIGPHDQRRRL
jgi:hypothetical protein